MMDICRYDGDLKRQRWVFLPSGAVYGSTSLILRSYHEEEREDVKKRKWTGPMWDSTDERSYHSKLLRPTEIPDDVIKEAISRMVIDVFIGWTNADSKYSDHQITIA